MKKHLMKQLLSCLLIISLVLACGQSVFAYSASKENKKAKKAYQKKLESLADKGDNLRYLYKDLTGDGVAEAIFLYATSDRGSGETLVIYSYEGKAKRILKEKVYGLSKIMSYTGYGPTLVLHAKGHGGERYLYYDMKKQIYILSCERGRTLGEEKGPWIYQNAQAQEISKSAFNKEMKMLTEGKKATTKVSSLKPYPGV